MIWIWIGYDAAQPFSLCQPRTSLSTAGGTWRAGSTFDYR